MDAMEAIRTRRSVRKMDSRIPDRELIEQVIEAGRCAPSGSNSRSTHMLVITDRAVLRDLAEKVRTAFAEMEEKEDTYISLKRSIRAARAGDYVFHYNAPVLIVTANRKGYGNALADSACVLENMMIAANALGLGSCWINQLHWLTDHPQIRDAMVSLGIGEEETITGGLILGYGEGEMPVRGPLSGNPVTWIE